MLIQKIIRIAKKMWLLTLSSLEDINKNGSEKDVEILFAIIVVQPA